MTDERITYAGDLGTDAIGKRVKVQTASGAIVTDELVGVLHLAGVGDGPAKTSVRFANTRPPFDIGRPEVVGEFFDVDPLSIATVD